MVGEVMARIGGGRRSARLKLWRYTVRKASLHVDSSGVIGEFSSAKWRHVVL